MLSFDAIPADVPPTAHETYIKNYTTITQQAGKLMLFAADQKIEHLDNDFYGPSIHADAHDPEHLFKIANKGIIGAFATHLGLIARYGKKYSSIPYIAKLNGKTDLVTTQYNDPISEQLWTINDVIALRDSAKLSMCGIGYTIYLGSIHESRMLAQAAQLVYQAHQYGLVTILWIYPRGKSIADDQDVALLAGATGVATSLGADFVKIKSPKDHTDLPRIISAAGNTKVICSGGSSIKPELFLHQLEAQLQAGVLGCATGRNIFQKSLQEAIAFTHAINAMIISGMTSSQALQLYHDKLGK